MPQNLFSTLDNAEGLTMLPKLRNRMEGILSLKSLRHVFAATVG